MKTIKTLLRSFLWNDDPWARWVIWGCWANAVYQSTPLGRSPWSVLPAMAVVAVGGVLIIRSIRAIRRMKDAHATLEKQGGYWAREMVRLKIELAMADQRFATQTEKDEIIARLEETKTRCEREIAVYQKSIR